ncbi:hypothetical protein [Dermatobacter hominis]|uniref:hypothetical protein n=1 Tax=Dermatobacter hominis TaxID=2884263 RepID=UPI001D114047|nr:hypothetical protein [Dermatobacter hominis]UDY36094.1 hypothetical protein LH044_00830 [Dermatobacter hominis]
MDPMAAAALISVVLDQVHAMSWAVAAAERGPAELWDGLVIGGVGAWQVTATWCDERRLAVRPSWSAVRPGAAVIDGVSELSRRAISCGRALELTWPAELCAAAGAELDELASRLPRRCRTALESDPVGWTAALTSVRRVGVGLALLERTAGEQFPGVGHAQISPMDGPADRRVPAPTVST